MCLADIDLFDIFRWLLAIICTVYALACQLALAGETISTGSGSSAAHASALADTRPAAAAHSRSSLCPRAAADFRLLILFLVIVRLHLS